VVSRRVFAIGLIGACILSAAVGTGTTLLLAERGPDGPRGETGPQGPPGEGTETAERALDQGEELTWRFGRLEDELFGVGERVAELELALPAAIAAELRELEAVAQEVCVSVEVYC
jgi:hypothetical protein